MNFTVNIEAQRAVWFILPLFPIFVIFFIGSVAETNRPPFDLAEAESELVSGFMTEHAGVIFVFFFLGEYASILLMCILINIFFLGGYLPLILEMPENFYFINTFVEDWSFKIWQLLFYNELFLNDAIKSCTVYNIDYKIYTIFIYSFNEVLFLIYDIITLISDYYIDLAIIVNNNENEDIEVLLLEGVFNSLILGLKSSIFIFIFIWVRASFPRIRYDQLMSLCWTVLLPLLFAFIFFVPCTLYSFDILPSNISILSAVPIMFVKKTIKKNSLIFYKFNIQLRRYRSYSTKKRYHSSTPCPFLFTRGFYAWSKLSNWFRWWRRMLKRLYNWEKKFALLIKTRFSGYSIFCPSNTQKILVRISWIVLLPNAFRCSVPQLPPQNSRWARNYSTLATTPRSVENFHLDPHWITGFADGEGCFTVSVIEHKEYKIGWAVKPRFQIGLHEKDKAILEGIKNSLRVGKIFKHKPKAVSLQVRSIKELKQIFEHFYKFPLITQKRADFLLLMQVIEIMERGEHLTIEGLHKIVAIKASMNLGLSDKLKVAFPDVVPVERPLVELPQKIDPHWLAGFTDAEGSFLIKVTPPSKTKVRQRVQLVWQLTQHSRDEKLMRSLIELLKSGKIYKNRDTFDFRVTKFDDIVNKIIPFFKKYPILGVKALDFADFCKVAEMMKDKKHLTAEGLDQIRKIKAGMNTGRKIS